MDFMILDKNGREKGYLPDDCSLDFELGTDNGDLQISCRHGVLEMGDFIVCYGTEYGAVMEESVITTDSEMETWYGESFRKLLEEIIICPEKGQDFRTVSGEANAILKELVNGQMGNFFSVSAADSGIRISSYQFDRYTDYLSGVSEMLYQQNAKLKILINSPFDVQLLAEPVADLSGSVEFSEDCPVKVTLTDNRRGINHLICLGSGKLKDRQVIHLYAWPDGSVKDSPYWTGFSERTAVYDYSSAENADDLKKQGIKHLQTIMNSQKMSVSVSDADLDIGDIVSGKSYAAGQMVQVPITGKIIQRQEDGQITTTYKTKGES